MALLNKIEKIFAIISLFLLSTALISLVPVNQTGDYNLGIKAIYIIIYLISFLFIIINKGCFNKIIKITSKQRLFTLFVLFVIASIIWSDDLLLTSQKVIAFLGTIIFAVYFATRFNQKEQINLLAYTCISIILLSCIMIIMLPVYGISTENPGAWQGVFNQKNILGKTMVLSSLVLFFYTKSEKSYLKKTLAGLFFLTSIFLIIMSKSKTAIIATIFIFSILIVIRALQKNKGKARIFLLLTALIFIVLAGIIIISYSDETLQVLNKDTTLTGRTILWSYSFEKIKEKLFFGYGYNSFWLDYNGPSKDIIYLLDWTPPHAHNGFIDLALELGIIGLSIFVLLFVVSILKALNLIKYSLTWIDLWPIIFLCLLLIYNLTENTMIKQNNIFFALFVVILYSLVEKRIK